MKKKLTTRSLKKTKGKRTLSMLTCYDFQTAQMLNATALDMILVGDSVGNVILGYDTTVQVTVNDMITFSSAVKRGAPETFIVSDLPFGSYASLDRGLENAIRLYQESGVEALKLEGSSLEKCQLIKQLTDNGIAVMGHLGLTPQSVNEQGGYYTHGKTSQSFNKIIKEAHDLQKAGCFALVLECVTKELSLKITKELNIPTIGIGSGDQVDGQVLVINDLLRMGPSHPPGFCEPVANLFDLKKELVSTYLEKLTGAKVDYDTRTH